MTARPATLRVKRALDVIGAALALVFLSPAFLAVAILVRLTLGSPVIFRQTRTGLNGAPFALMKFRTMREAVDRDGRPLPDAARLTPLGQFLRRWSLDELPELVHVLRGDMSLVGPRPLLPEYLPYYSADQQRRHLVRPGITGWSQVNGRNALSWADRLALDVVYVDRLSLGFDLQILARTIGVVLSRQGISAPGHATMPRFDDEVRARRSQ